MKADSVLATIGNTPPMVARTLSAFMSLAPWCP